MADFRTKAVTPAAISYTPLDLSKVRGQLGQKVQEVEGAAAAGNNLMAQLNFKDGYMLEGQAKELQNEYSGKVKSLVEGLYSNGDTRSFSSELSLLANSLNTDERILAGQKDYELSKVHDQYGMDPTNRSLHYGYTSDNSSTGKITQLDWKNKDVSSQDVQNAYKIYGKVDFYKDYNTMFEDLNTTTFEEYMSLNADGFLEFKTTKGPTDLSQEIGNFTQEELAAEAVRIENPNLFRRLQSDYENSATSSANTYKEGMGKSLEEFIGGVVLENLPFLEDTSFKLQTPPTDTTNPTDSLEGGIDMKSEAYATVISDGAMSQVSAEADLTNDEVAATLGYGDVGSRNQAVTSIAAVLNNDEATEAQKSLASFTTAILNDFDNYGDATRSKLYKNGNELKASAKEATSELLNNPMVLQSTFGSPGRNLRRYYENQDITGPIRETSDSFVEVYKDIIGNQDPVEFFHKILNTRNLLGQSRALGFNLEDKENLITDYDGETHPEYTQHITNGIGFLTPGELEGVLNRLEEEQFLTIGVTGSSKYKQSHLGIAIDTYNRASDYFTLPNGETRKINRKMPFEKDIEPYLKQIKESNPVAFNEMAHVDMMLRSSLYHTDVVIKPDRIFSDEIMAPAFKKTAEEFAGVDIVRLGQMYELSEILSPEEGGLSGTKSTGVNSDRLEKINGTGVIKSPYQEVLFSSNKGGKWLKEFMSFGAGTNPETLNFNFHGMLMPGGRANDAGLIVSRTNGTKTTQWLLQPKTNTTMENNPLYAELQTAQKNLTGKNYLPTIVTGDAYINQSGAKLYKSVQEDIDLRNINVDFYYTDTLAGLSNTRYFSPQENIMAQGAGGTVAAVPNLYVDGSVSVVADLQKGNEIYRLRSKDGTGDIKWGEYLDTYKKEIDDPANTYLGAQDYRDFIVSLYLNQDFINQNGGNINKDKVLTLLQENKLQSIQNITESLGTDWKTLINIPITFFDKKNALYHFGGQPGERGNIDKYGNYQSGYQVK